MEKLYIFQSYRDVEVSHAYSASPDSTRYERHCHERYELIYIPTGEGKYIVEGMEYPLLPHSLFLLRPYEYHYVCPEVSHPYERFVIYFEQSILPETLSRHKLLRENGTHFFTLENSKNPIRAAFDALVGITALSPDGSAGSPEAEALLHATIIQILLLLTKETPHPPEDVGSATVHRVIEYLNAHLREELSLDVLAKEFFISKYHLCRIFRSRTGVSILTYFNEKRLALAKQMIAEGESATSVAVKLGYRDYSTFYRAYKRHIGKAPVRTINTTK